MARRTEGLGADSKVPLRGLIDLFKELDGPTKNTLRSAFVDAEDLQNYFSKSVPERQTRRKISGRIDTITLTAESTLLGGFLKWNRLPDRRIAFYEIQISDNNVFSSFETYTQVETFLALENLRSTKFARVRGVTASGLTGLFSNTARIRPKVSAPKVYSLDFYQRYGSESDPNLSKKLIYSGNDRFNRTSFPSFYNIFSDNFYLDRDIGGGLVWGSFSSRLKNYEDSGPVPWDRVRFKLNGISISDTYVPHWTINYDEIDFHDNELNFYNQPMTFYGKGGYTCSFGPHAVTLPNSLAGYGANDPHSAATIDLTNSAFYWNDITNALVPSRFDESQCERYNDALPRHEAHSRGITENGTTDYLLFRDFKFNLDATDVVTGIQLDIKRRQPNIFNDDLGANFGVKRPDRGLGHDFVQEYNIGTNRLQKEDILESVTFGKFLDFTTQITQPQNPLAAGQMRHDILGVTNDGISSTTGTKLFTKTGFTISAWFRVPTPLTTYMAPSTNPDSYICAFDSASPVGDVQMLVRLNRSTNAIDFYQVLFQRSGRSYLVRHTVTTSDARSRVNVFHHFAFVWDSTIGSGGKIVLFIDGLPVNSPTIETNTFTATEKNFFTGNQNWRFHIGTPLITQSQSILSMNQLAIWDRVLTGASGLLEDSEIYSLFLASGRSDYRYNFSSYRSAEELNHYFLSFPDQSDIRDLEIRLTDSTGVRTDLQNKAITDESWPRLGHFFYTDLRQYGFLPIALSMDGIPHDNHSAIGYQKYGGSNDLWGQNWTPAQVNDFYFGCAIRVINEISQGFRGSAFIDHAKMTIYTVPESSRNVQIDVEVAAASEFYLQREIYGGIVNLIEMGEKLSEL